MYIFSSFPQSVHLEMAISELEQAGIARDRILAVPLDRRPSEPSRRDPAVRTDRLSLVDGAAVLGTAVMVLGVIYGFVLPGGPIIWGIAGLLAGAAAGFGLDYFRHPRRTVPGGGKNSAGGVVLLVRCGREETATVTAILWRNFAGGVGCLER